MSKPKKKQQTKFNFRCPLFEIDVNLIIGEREDVERFAHNLNLNEYVAGGCWEIENTIGENKARSFLIWICDKENLGHMVHETLHLTKMIFDCYGVLFNSANDEIIAYYQNYWVRKFWNKMCKFVKDKK